MLSSEIGFSGAHLNIFDIGARGIEIPFRSRSRVKMPAKRAHFYFTSFLQVTGARAYAAAELRLAALLAEVYLWSIAPLRRLLWLHSAISGFASRFAMPLPAIRFLIRLIGQEYFHSFSIVVFGR